MARDAIESRRLEIAGGMIANALPRVASDRSFPAWVSRTLSGDKRFGSRDRRFYRELIYSAARYLPWIEGVSPESRALASLWLSAGSSETREARETLLPDNSDVPEKLEKRATVYHSLFAGKIPSVAGLFPEWVARECPALLEPDEAATILRRAPLWLRVQRGKTEAAIDALDADGVKAQASPQVPGAVRVLSGPDVTRTSTYASGLVEVQDIGSQWVLHKAAPVPGERWIDACAGAGGKTLQLAAMLGQGTPIVATDVRPAALAELEARVTRAGISGIKIIAKPEGLFDAVLVDSPCSGSGTWRRSPHLRFQTTQADLSRSASLQSELLRALAAHVRPGGRLVYATCSLAPTENSGTIRSFLAADPRFAAETPGDDLFGATLMPSALDSDGFFLSVLRRRQD